METRDALVDIIDMTVRTNILPSAFPSRFLAKWVLIALILDGLSALVPMCPSPDERESC